MREALGLEVSARGVTVPARHTRERSLRPRSTSITCSARSFSDPSSRSASPSPGASRAGDRVQRGPPALRLDERLGRGADQREAVQLEQEQVRRRVDAPQRAVELERRRRRRPLCPLREHDLEGVAGPDVLLRAHHRTLVLVSRGQAAGRARRRPGLGRRRRGLRAREQVGHGSRLAAEHLGHPEAVVESDERVGDDEAASGSPRPSSGKRHGGLQPGGVVVAEVADDGQAATSRPRRSRPAASPAPMNECRPSRPFSTDSSRKLARPDSRRRR